WLLGLRVEICGQCSSSSEPTSNLVASRWPVQRSLAVCAPTTTKGLVGWSIAHTVRRQTAAAIEESGRLLRLKALETGGVSCTSRSGDQVEMRSTNCGTSMSVRSGLVLPFDLSDLTTAV